MKRIGLSLGLTLNAGNYNSVRVEARLDQDFPDDVDTHQAFDEVYEDLEEELVDKVSKLFTLVQEEGIIR